MSALDNPPPPLTADVFYGRSLIGAVGAEDAAASPRKYFDIKIIRFGQI